MAELYDKRDDTQCRYCGGKLSFLQRMSRQEFCSPEHRQSFQREQEELALARLQLALDPPAQKAPPPPPELPPLAPVEPEPAVESLEVAPGSGFAEDDEEPAGLCQPLVVQPPPVASQIPCQDEMGQEALASGATAFPVLRLPTPERQWAPAGGSPNLHGLVRPAPGDLLTIFVLPPAEESATLACRMPAMGLERAQWDRIEEEEHVRLSEPPMAGLVPIKGPQTLKVQIGLSRPSAEPEHPVASPNTSVPIPHTARTAGPRMGGVRAFRTRIGAAGKLRPATGGATEPIEVRGEITPTMPRMNASGLSGSALGSKPDSGVPAEEAVRPAAAGEGSGDLRMDGSQIPSAGYCSLGGGPLDREASPRLAPPSFPPFDLPAVRALLSASVHDRCVPIESFSARRPDAPVIERPDASPAGPDQPPAVLLRLSGSPELGALPTGEPIRGYQVINLITIRQLEPVRRPAGESHIHGAEPPAPRPARVNLPAPDLRGAGCHQGVEPRIGGMGPRRDWDSLGPAISGKPGVWKASAASAPPPVLRRGNMVGLEVDSPGAPPSGALSEEISPALDSVRVAPRKPSHAAPSASAGVPALEQIVRWPIRPKDSLAEPDLQAIGCSFASGGGLWDSLT
ncbi:MAG: hypothetical protein R2762_25425 [Bryobacteraceae bacterium]